MTMDPSRVRISGPLAEHALGFGEVLRKCGYPCERAARHVQLLAQLSRWMERQGLGERELSEERVAEFLAARRAEGYYDKPTLSWVLTVLGLVPGLDVARAEPAPLKPVESAVVEYAHYLSRERGLATKTVRGYTQVASLFLSPRVSIDGDLDLSQVNAKAVITFVIDESRRRSVGAAQVLVTALRSLLRFLFLEGRIAQPLAQAVPAARPRRASCPEDSTTRWWQRCSATATPRRSSAGVISPFSRCSHGSGFVPARSQGLPSTTSTGTTASSW